MKLSAHLATLLMMIVALIPQTVNQKWLLHQNQMKGSPGNSLQWNSIESWNKELHLLTFYTIIYNYVNLQTSFRATRDNQLKFVQLQPRIDAFKFSFYPNYCIILMHTRFTIIHNNKKRYGRVIRPPERYQNTWLNWLFSYMHILTWFRTIDFVVRMQITIINFL